LDDVEATLDSGKNFTAYKQRLKTVDAACVPFLGAFPLVRRLNLANTDGVLQGSILLS
jgi:hypothetical protein